MAPPSNAPPSSNDGIVPTRRRAATTTTAASASKPPRECVRYNPPTGAGPYRQNHQHRIANQSLRNREVKTSGITQTINCAKSFGSLMNPRPRSL